MASVGSTCGREPGSRDGVGEGTSEAVPDPLPVALRANPRPRLGTRWEPVPGPRLTALFWTLWASSIQLVFPFTHPPAALTELGGRGRKAFSARQQPGPGPLLPLTVTVTATREVALRLPNADRVEEVLPLWVGRGPDEWLVKIYCRHIPSCLDHLLNNVCHSFTRPPHILASGRVPVTQEVLCDQRCQAPSPNT